MRLFNLIPGRVSRGWNSCRFYRINKRLFATYFIFISSRHTYTFFPFLLFSLKIRFFWCLIYIIAVTAIYYIIVVLSLSVLYCNVPLIRRYTRLSYSSVLPHPCGNGTSNWTSDLCHHESIIENYESCWCGFVHKKYNFLTKQNL